MSDARRHLEQLAELVGRWEGQGSARFPTIEDCPYREELAFTWNTAEPLLHYEQRTWRLSDAEPLHWESGFLMADDDGLFTLANSQNGPRVELLEGRLASAADGVLELGLASRFHAGDARMLKTTRRWRLAGGRFSYSVWMATTRVPALSFHLEAVLDRVR